MTAEVQECTKNGGNGLVETSRDCIPLLKTKAVNTDTAIENLILFRFEDLKVFWYIYLNLIATTILTFIHEICAIECIVSVFGPTLEIHR